MAEKEVEVFTKWQKGAYLIQIRREPKHDEGG